MASEIALYLASKSPRRRELLNQLGISFSILSPNVDESLIYNEKPEDYVIRLAKKKAITSWELVELKNIPILGSDTSVVIDNEILGKPTNNDDAIRMLNLLSGKTHHVMTAVALVIPGESRQQPELKDIISVSEVSFKLLSELEIEQYVNSGECNGKAGSYAIQGLAAAFITHLSGSYSGVMGLPLYETCELLNSAGIR